MNAKTERMRRLILLLIAAIWKMDTPSGLCEGDVVMSLNQLPYADFAREMKNIDPETTKCIVEAMCSYGPMFTRRWLRAMYPGERLGAEWEPDLFALIDDPEPELNIREIATLFELEKCNLPNFPRLYGVAQAGPVIDGNMRRRVITWASGTDLVGIMENVISKSQPIDKVKITDTLFDEIMYQILNAFLATVEITPPGFQHNALFGSNVRIGGAATIRDYTGLGGFSRVNNVVYIVDWRNTTQGDPITDIVTFLSKIGGSKAGAVLAVAKKSSSLKDFLVQSQQAQFSFLSRTVVDEEKPVYKTEIKSGPKIITSIIDYITVTDKDLQDTYDVNRDIQSNARRVELTLTYLERRMDELRRNSFVKHQGQQYFQQTHFDLFYTVTIKELIDIKVQHGDVDNWIHSIRGHLGRDKNHDIENLVKMSGGIKDWIDVLVEVFERAYRGHPGLHSFFKTEYPVYRRVLFPGELE